MKTRLGTVSHGTLRSEDLIPAFLVELRTLTDGNARDARTIREISDWLETPGADDEFAPEMVDELIEALNAYAPDGCYFGTHEGDGSDFGFWECDQDDEAAPSITCGACVMISINGMACHEYGCVRS